MSRKAKRYKNHVQTEVTELQNTPGATTPSYMPGGINPFTTGLLPQDIPVEDPRFKVTSMAPYSSEIVTRSTVWDYYRTAIALPNPSKILGSLNANIDAFDELLADARVKACLNNRRAGLLSLKWNIDQAEAPVRLFKLVQKIFDGLDIPTLMGEMALATFYGYNVSEINWKVDNNLIVPETVISKAARWFWYDDANTLRYRTKMNQTLGEALPPRKFLVTRYHPRFDNPYGESLAEGVYWPVKFRHIIFQYAMQFLQKYGTPWLDITTEAGLQENRIREILDTIQNTYEDGIVAHPDNTKIEVMAVGDSKSIESYTTMLDNVNREIDMSILGTNLSAEIKGGSFAAAQTAAGVRQDIVDEDKRMIEGSLNTLIEWIAWYNFPHGVSLPKFRLYKIEPGTKEKAEVDIMLAKLGVKFTKEYFAKTYQINSDEFELGEPVQDLGVGMKGEVVSPDMNENGNTIVTKDKHISASAKVAQDAMAESHDQATSTTTKEAMHN